MSRLHLLAHQPSAPLKKKIIECLFPGIMCGRSTICFIIRHEVARQTRVSGGV